MKILYIGGEPLPGSGGGSVHFTEVTEGLKKLGWDVMVCVPMEDGYPDEENIGGLKIIRVNMKLKGKTFPILALKRWRKFIDFNPDILMERYVTFGGACSILSQKLKKPVVLEVNSPHTKEFIFRFGIKNRLIIFLLNKWSEFQFKCANKVVSTLDTVIPEFARDKFIAVEWAANNDLFNPGAINEKERMDLKKQLSINDEPVVIFLGTFRNWHGISHLPLIIKNVVSEVPCVKFILIGEGSERKSVEDKIRSLSLQDSVRFTGVVPYKNVPLYLSLGTIGIAPYDRSEYPPLKEFGFFWSPLKIFEYMAAKMPVVTIDIAPLNRLVENGKRGYVVAEGDYRAFSDKIIELLKSPDRCSIMGKTARDFVCENYSWKKHVDHLNSELIQLISGKR